ncbi:hypothetical protein A1O7_06102 [Cladophialophora yegresii CBS 114405]|uniref:Uncharacterized protein n=1 Tax=Cladophialophora yegresii CBS 114405 TaxID=1182544 RepID=W9WJK3_9EURO|nr:uncharacterized protein A1O7_06102 [Cladophialophora yegresii CBS 114405]EXJ58674.1 hypothetical protein A1O7_06102 [Cladophialophora yegresii CBS 114405]
MALSRPSSKKSLSFDSEVYWEHRFTASQTPFEWLTPIDVTASILEKEIGNALNAENSRFDETGPSILHIGCGTSDLSLRLRDYVRRPVDVHNVDFSRQAVKLGQQREKEYFGQAALPGAGIGEKTQVNQFDLNASWMRWSNVDLLSRRDVLSLTNEGTTLYDFVVDKSTSDAIACGDDVDFLPASVDHGEVEVASPMHPMEVLAMHLAAVTAMDGRWIIISYSTERFWFLEHKPKRPSDFLSNGNTGQQFGRKADPKKYWRLDRKEPLAASESGSTPCDNVHRPQIYHWLYVLVRTTVPFQARLLQ